VLGAAEFRAAIDDLMSLDTAKIWREN